MKKNIHNRLKTYSLNIISFSKTLNNSFELDYIRKQLIRPSCSAGANAAEADGATSKKEFIHKFSISQRELKESRYWLSLLSELAPNLKDKIYTLNSETEELIKIISTIIVRSKNNLQPST